jgi:copper ion binding protein
MLFGKKETLAVKGMSCGHCEQAVEKGLADVPGVSKVKADHGKSQVTVHYKGDSPDMDVVKQTITDLGYEVQ